MPAPLGTAASGVRDEPYGTVRELSPVAYWRMNQASSPITNYGSLGSGKNLSVTGTTLEQPAVPERSADSSILFDDANLSVLTCTDAIISGLDRPFSIGFWLKFTQAPTPNTVTIFQQFDGSSSSGIQVTLSPDATQITLTVLGTDGATDLTLTIGYVVGFNDDEPHLIGFSCPGTGTCYAYVDGQPVASATRSSGTLASTSDCFVGRYAVGSANGYEGLIDEMFITNDVVTEAEWLRTYRRSMLTTFTPFDNALDAMARPFDPVTNSTVAVDVHRSVRETFDAYAASLGLSPITQYLSGAWVGFKASAPTAITFTVERTTRNAKFAVFRTTTDDLNDIERLFTGSSTSFSITLNLSPTDTYLFWFYDDTYSFGGAALGPVDITWVDAPPGPANDNFADAEEIDVSTPDNVTGNTTNSTVETPLETSWMSNEYRSVWYTFTAPSTGSITLDTEISNTADTTIAVWENVSSISEIDFDVEPFAFDDDGGIDFTAVCTFSVVAGSTYHVQISDYDGGTAFTLRWSAIT